MAKRVLRKIQPSSMNRQYVVISPCRNEADFMRQTLDSMVCQSILPKLWVIVDDGSTDQTPEILAEYATRHDWIRIITCTNRGHRAVGPGVIEAFYAGYEFIDLKEYDYICKLDLDLRLPEGYFEGLMKRMGANPKIATCSGKAYIEKPDGSLVSERHGDENSIGASKFYRATSFLELGGFVREVMWDGIDGHRCRMRGLVACSWDDDELRFVHLRPMGSSQQSVYVGRMRHGYGQYYMGSGLIWMLATAVYRIPERPYVIGGLCILWGWLKSYFQRLPRYEEPGFRKFLHHYHRRSLLVGKRRAILELENNIC